MASLTPIGVQVALIVGAMVDVSVHSGRRCEVRCHGGPACVSGPAHNSHTAGNGCPAGSGCLGLVINKAVFLDVSPVLLPTGWVSRFPLAR